MEEEEGIKSMVCLTILFQIFDRSHLILSCKSSELYNYFVPFSASSCLLVQIFLTSTFPLNTCMVCLCFTEQNK